jgi:hypothetical protein
MSVYLKLKGMWQGVRSNFLIEEVGMFNTKEEADAFEAFTDTSRYEANQEQVPRIPHMVQ